MIIRWSRTSKVTTGDLLKTPSGAVIKGAATTDFAPLLLKDPKFSEVLFLDCSYTLFSQVHEARGKNQLVSWEATLSGSSISALESLSTEKLLEVSGIVVAACTISSVSYTESEVTCSLDFEACYTETASSAQGFYSVEKWNMTRSLDPTQIKSAGKNSCRGCGSTAERSLDGACPHCGVKTLPETFGWRVSEIAILRRETRGPNLTTTVEERGTDLPTVFHPRFTIMSKEFTAVHADFTWDKFKERVSTAFLEIQSGWTELAWERARPFETDCLFQTHKYWIEEYHRQSLRNVLEEITISQVEPVKIGWDSYFDAITVRIFASMKDYTVDSSGKKVSGSKSKVRHFTEYWTFISRRGAKKSKSDNPKNCPNCGALLKISMTGICEYCNAKVSSGEFDWIASRIEQDDVYRG